MTADMYSGGRAGTSGSESDGEIGRGEMRGVFHGDGWRGRGVHSGDVGRGGPCIALKVQPARRVEAGLIWGVGLRV